MIPVNFYGCAALIRACGRNLHCATAALNAEMKLAAQWLRQPCSHVHFISFFFIYFFYFVHYLNVNVNPFAAATSFLREWRAGAAGSRHPLVPSATPAVWISIRRVSGLPGLLTQALVFWGKKSSPAGIVIAWLRTCSDKRRIWAACMCMCFLIFSSWHTGCCENAAGLASVPLTCHVVRCNLQAR